MSDSSEKRWFTSGVFVLLYGLASISAAVFLVQARYSQLMFVVGAACFLRFAQMNPEVLNGDPFLRGIAIGETKGLELVAVGSICWVISILAL